MQALNQFPLKSDKETQIDFLVKLLDLNYPIGEVQLKKLAGGITNAVFLLDTPDKKYIVRVYGNKTEEIIDRKREQEHMSTIKLITIYATFENGMVVSYVEGKTIDLSMMGDPSMSPKIARAIAKFHKATFFDSESGQNNRRNEIFPNIKVFLNGLKSERVHEKTDQRIDINHLTEIYKKIQEELEDVMEDSKICLCHNDILAGNILYDEENGANLCDYEYSSYTWPEFDIANHFFEYCGFQCDLRRFPSESQQRNFIVNYLSELYDVSNKEIQTNEIYIKMAEVWLKKIKLLVKLSNFFWGSWAFFQAFNSEVDFPYFEYAETRINLIDCQFPLSENDPKLKEPLVSL